MGVIDTYAVGNADSNAGLQGGFTGIGQGFTGNGNAVGSAQFQASRTGSPTGNAVAKIYAYGGTTFGTDDVPGTLLATSDTIAASSISTSVGLVTFTFSGGNQITLSNGTHYVLTIEYSAGSSGNQINVYYDGSAPTHGGNLVLNASGWGAQSTLDTVFVLNDNLPTITEVGSLSNFGSVLVGQQSSSQNFSVSGANLTANIVVTSPSSDFQVSTDNSNWFSSVTLTQSGGTVGTTTIYARLNPQTPGAKSGNIAITSTGATTQNVAVAGTGYTVGGRNPAVQMQPIMAQ